LNRRTFLTTSALISTGSIFSLTGCKTNKPVYKNESLHNWAGNINYSTRNVYYPSSIDQVQQIIKDNSKIKCLGSRHSFSRIADSDGCLLSTTNLKSILKLDRQTNSVTVEPGITYGELSVFLQQNGFALHNLASLPHISVGGACATATHGSGVNNGNLSTIVNAMEFVDGSGNVHIISRKNDSDTFNGSVVNLGALGVVTKLTLDVVPDYNMKQVVYRNLPFENLKQSFYDIMSSGYSVSLFTNWTKESINQVWIKSIHNDSDASVSPSDFFGASKSEIDLHPVDTQSAENVTIQRGIKGKWYEVLPHFKMGFKPSTGKELQSEFFVHKDAGFQAIQAMQTLSRHISPHLFVSEIRSIKADQLWMRPAYQKDCISIHTTWHQSDNVISELIPLVQNALLPFHPIPHWAKLSSIPKSSLAGLYPRMDDFRGLCRQFDPQKKFLNKYLQEFILV